MIRKTDTPITPRKSSEVPTAQGRSGSETEELRHRIERLEERLDASILGDDGLAELDQGIDKSPAGDALRKAVRRSNARRGRDET